METKTLDRPRSLGRMLNFATAATNRTCNALLADHDLQLAQWVLLSALWRRDGLQVSELSDYAQQDLPAISRLIARMEAKGLLERRADPGDRRAVRVFLTAKGRGLDGLAGFHERVNDLLLSGFTAAEAEQLYDLLDRVRENALRADPRRGPEET